MMRYWWLFLVIAMGCGRPQPVVEVPPSVVLVEVEQIESRQEAKSIEVVGTLAPWEEVQLSVEAEGRLSAVLVDLGSEVKKNEVLVRIDDRAYVWKKAQAQAEEAAARADLDRLRSLVAKDMATKQQLDEALRRHGVARAALDLAKKSLGDTALRAPFDGTIARRMVQVGEWVRPGTGAFYLVSSGPLKLQAEVGQEQMGLVQVGDEVLVQAGALSLSGSIVRVGPAVSTLSRAFPVEARIENPGQKVKPGAFATATIVTQVHHEVISVPAGAVTLFAGNPRVFVVEGDVARERVVTILRRQQDRVVVGTGLEGGEMVVLEGADRLMDGQRVSVGRAE